MAPRRRLTMADCLLEEKFEKEEMGDKEQIILLLREALKKKMIKNQV